MNPLEIRLLGPLEVFRDGQVVEVPGGRRRVLLAILALGGGRPVPLDEVVDRLWDSDPPPTARATVRSHAGRLRLVLGQDDPSPVVCDPAGYRFRPGGAVVDVDRFRELAAEADDGGDAAVARTLLARALGLWRGEALAGVGSPALARDVAPALEEERLAVLTRWAALVLEGPRPEEAVPKLRTALLRHPLREDLWRQLVLAQFRAGREAEALAEYERCRTALRAGSGAEPGADLAELHQRILRHDTRSPTGPPGRSAGQLAGREERSPRQMPVPRQLPPDTYPFVGREAALARLDEIFGARPDGGAQVLVWGPPGVGKSALAVHWGHRRGDLFPDGQLYVDLADLEPGESAGGERAGPSKALTALLTGGEVPVHQVAHQEEERVAQLREALGRRRALVILDNALGADQVRPLLSALTDLAGAVLVTSRDELGTVASGPRTVRLPLGPFSTEEAATLLFQLGALRPGDLPRSLATAVELCAGSPLALRMVAEYAARLPDLGLDELIPQGHLRGAVRSALRFGAAPTPPWRHEATPPPTGPRAPDAPPLSVVPRERHPC
ncbi:BTAD domain-containing putative transcriptional regulator [Streptomyces albidoflavus]|uniref:AfsR/SARP family transcriptional regulator n=1 Tax=Streptomyces albidoflavus TaxID=1886 RepID=UPI0033AAA2B7